ncbi:T9SS type A sorting domain-containing protein [Maribellus mangrovi]|uniref:T9SS type A sorting domain-containing protein n=1 Tax=Maribellus mangrovi TaxID=3133146 RepID=UPI0030ED796D
MIRLSKILFAIFGVSVALFTSGQQLAFPGAEGYGRFASGGRGNGETGRVVEVTNLEDDLENPPEGSLRWAFSQATEKRIDPILGIEYTVKLPLTIVFRVGGVINLIGELRVQRDRMTIAGQTAPGNGICIRGATVNFSGSNNVIVRYIRFRPGDELGEETSAFRIENGSNFIIDHCSMSWAIEETTHFSSNSNTTVQWCIISESLFNSIHKKGERGYATQWGGQYASYHHNLLAHHNSRMPRINGSNKNDINALVDYRNNVNYNWSSTGAFYGGEFEGTDGNGFCHTNVVNNYFIPGPATSSNVIFARPSYNRSGVQVDGYGQWYFNGNVMEGYEAMTNDNWLGVDGGNIPGGKENIRSEEEFVKSDGALEDYDAYTQSAEEALSDVLAEAGATLPKRDTIDRRIITEAQGMIEIVRYEHISDDDQVTPKKGVESGIIDTQQNLVPEDKQDSVTAWDVYTKSTEAPVDADHDGIPDEWEMDNGLDPNDITDGRLIAENGYSNLENYLNGLTLTVAVDDIRSDSHFRIYPNPADHTLYFQTADKLAQVSLFDLNGRKLISSENKEGVTSLSIQTLPNGIYMLQAIGIKRTYSQKVFKK